VTRISILLTVLLLIVAACGTPASSGSASQEATEEATPTPSPTPEPSPTEGAVEEPSLEPGAGDLADLLPEEVGGITINYQHASGEAVFGSEGVTPEVQAFFDRVGASPDDLSSAFGFAFDAEAATGVSIVAFRVEGSDESTLRTEFLGVMEEEGEVIGEETTVSGKSVHTFGEAGSSGFLYVNDDVVYIVAGDPPTIAEEALAALP
jgi:hypothetical protein